MAVIAKGKKGMKYSRRQFGKGELTKPDGV
jgi:hypothetical protein